MYVPIQYRQADESWSKDLMASHPLAVLVTNGPEVPFATHLPTVFSPQEKAQVDAGAPLVGRTLHGHLNRLNPHWQALSGETASVLVFHGPGVYVSPTLYEVTPAAPTWNFTALHLRGVVRPLADRERAMEVVRWTAAALEGRFGEGWDMGPSLAYFERIVGGVGAFAFEIRSFEAMFKLSQEQPPEVRERVAESFATRGGCPHGELAALMRRLSPREGEGDGGIASTSGRASGSSRSGSSSEE